LKLKPYQDFIWCCVYLRIDQACILEGAVWVKSWEFYAAAATFFFCHMYMRTPNLMVYLKAVNIMKKGPVKQKSKAFEFLCATNILSSELFKVFFYIFMSISYSSSIISLCSSFSKVSFLIDCLASALKVWTFVRLLSGDDSPLLWYFFTPINFLSTF